MYIYIQIWSYMDCYGWEINNFDTFMATYQFDLWTGYAQLFYRNEPNSILEIYDLKWILKNELCTCYEQCQVSIRDLRFVYSLCTNSGGDANNKLMNTLMNILWTYYKHYKHLLNKEKRSSAIPSVFLSTCSIDYFFYSQLSNNVSFQEWDCWYHGFLKKYFKKGEYPLLHFSWGYRNS